MYKPVSKWATGEWIVDGIIILLQHWRQGHNKPSRIQELQFRSLIYSTVAAAWWGCQGRSFNAFINGRKSTSLVIIQLACTAKIISGYLSMNVLKISWERKSKIILSELFSWRPYLFQTEEPETALSSTEVTRSSDVYPWPTHLEILVRWLRMGLLSVSQLVSAPLLAERNCLPSHTLKHLTSIHILSAATVIFCFFISIYVHHLNNFFILKLCSF